MSVGDVYQKISGAWVLIGSIGGGSGTGSVKINCTQTDHGFAVMDCIACTITTGFYKVTLGSLGYPDIGGAEKFVGIVETITDDDNFVLVPPGGTIVTPGGTIGGTTFAAGKKFYLSNTSAGALTNTQPSSSSSSFIDLLVLTALDSINGVVNKFFTPDLNKRIADIMGGFLQYVSPTTVTYQYATSNQLTLWDGNSNIVCQFVANMEFITTGNDIGGVAVAALTYYDIFAKFNAWNANPILYGAKWADSTLGDAHRAIDWVTGTPYKIGDRRINSAKEVYTCYVAHTSGSTSEPGIGASWESYWIWTSYNYDDTTAWAPSQLETVGCYRTNIGKLWNMAGEEHTSSADDEPGVGINWQDYWVDYGIIPDETLWGLGRDNGDKTTGYYCLCGDSTGVFDGRMYRYVGTIYTYDAGGSVPELRNTNAEPSIGNYYNREFSDDPDLLYPETVVTHGSTHAYGSTDPVTNLPDIRATLVAGEAIDEFSVCYTDTTDSGKAKEALAGGTEAQRAAWLMLIEDGGLTEGNTGDFLARGFVTNPSWTWTPGAILWLDTSAGGMTETKPESNPVQLAHVTEVGTTIYFCPGGQGGSASSVFTGGSAWATDTDYVAYDVVDNDGSSYWCHTGHHSGATTEPGTGVDWRTVWGLIAEKGDSGSPGTPGADGADGVDGIDGEVTFKALRRKMLYLGE